MYGSRRKKLRKELKHRSEIARRQWPQAVLKEDDKVIDDTYDPETRLIGYILIANYKEERNPSKRLYRTRDANYFMHTMGGEPETIDMVMLMLIWIELSNILPKTKKRKLNKAMDLTSAVELIVETIKTLPYHQSSYCTL